MAEIIVSSNGLLPLPSVNVAVRAANLDDLPFIDRLQKMHAKMVGWMPTKSLQQKILAGQVLVAEMGESVGVSECGSGYADTPTRPHSHTSSPVGYCIGQDQYFKRDDVGIIYQMNVVPGHQRGLIGATLLKAMFERAAWGCKLFCCWCAQDIEANRFWEAMGFVPLAFRAGSEKKSRVHIFWQKRIRRGDASTPWWFPSKTTGGSIREDRIVLPIPPGTHWSEAMPLVLPTAETPELSVVRGPLSVAGKKHQAKNNGPRTTDNRQSPAAIRANGLRFAIPAPSEAPAETKPAKEPKPKLEKVKRICDPRWVSAARELRDRWLERVNEEEGLLACGKYEVGRLFEEKEILRQMPLLEQAA